MRVTKYPQSCLLVEDLGGGRLLIDPGTPVTRDRSLDDLGQIDAVLYTHRHADHFDPAWTEPLLERGVPIFANADTCSLIEVGGATTVEGGETFVAAGLEVIAHDIPHVPMVDGSDGPPNLGFDVGGRLLHSGDGVAVTGLAAEILAAPIAGPSISNRDAYVMIAETGARTTIPVHYDVFLADPRLFAGFCDHTEVVVLADGESTEL